MDVWLFWNKIMQQSYHFKGLFLFSFLFWKKNIDLGYIYFMDLQFFFLRYLWFFIRLLPILGYIYFSFLFFSFQLKNLDIIFKCYILSFLIILLKKIPIKLHNITILINKIYTWLILIVFLKKKYLFIYKIEFLL